MTLAELTEAMHAFVRAKGWYEPGSARPQTLRNLAISLSLEAAEVLEHTRYVQDGNVVTAAGVSAGIDMALWLTGELHSPDLARAVQRGMEYDPAPPYAGLT